MWDKSKAIESLDRYARPHSHGHPHGRMTMFDGRHWVADFVQLYGLCPGPSCRAARPAYAIHRDRS